MATTTVNLIDGLTFSDGKDGVEFTIPATVSELTGSTALNRIDAAFSQLTSDGYSIGSSITLSSLGVTASLVSRRLTGVSTTAVKVTLQYKTDDVAKGGDKTDPTVPVYKGSVRLVQKTTFVDRTGAQITVTDPTGGPDQHPSAVVLVPQATVSISRIEDGIKPLDAANAILGRLNSKPWNGAAGVWLCTGIDFSSDDGGGQWTMEYEFQQDADGEWNPRVTATNDKGDAIAGVTVDNGGVAVVDWYTSYDYNAQGL